MILIMMMIMTVMVMMNWRIRILMLLIIIMIMMVMLMNMLISIYKLGDVGISSNLIGSLSLTTGHCPPPGRWIMKQWPA